MSLLIFHTPCSHSVPKVPACVFDLSIVTHFCFGVNFRGWTLVVMGKVGSSFVVSRERWKLVVDMLGMFVVDVGVEAS